MFPNLSAFQVAENLVKWWFFLTFRPFRGLVYGTKGLSQSCMTPPDCAYEHRKPPKILGHENRTTTEIFLHSIGRAERRAMEIFERASRDLGLGRGRSSGKVSHFSHTIQ